MFPPQKAVIQCFQYRDMLESGKVATVSELAAKVKQERAFLCRALSLVNLAFGHHRRHPQRSRTRHTHSLQTPKKLPRKTGPSRGGFFEWSEKIKTTPSRRWYRQPDTGFELFTTCNYCPTTANAVIHNKLIVATNIIQCHQMLAFD